MESIEGHKFRYCWVIRLPTGGLDTGKIQQASPGYLLYPSMPNFVTSTNKNMNQTWKVGPVFLIGLFFF